MIQHYLEANHHLNCCDFIMHEIECNSSGKSEEVNATANLPIHKMIQNNLHKINIPEISHLQLKTLTRWLWRYLTGIDARRSRILTSILRSRINWTNHDCVSIHDAI